MTPNDTTHRVCNKTNQVLTTQWLAYNKIYRTLITPNLVNRTINVCSGGYQNHYNKWCSQFKHVWLKATLGYQRLYNKSPTANDKALSRWPTVLHQKQERCFWQNNWELWVLTWLALRAGQASFDLPLTHTNIKGTITRTIVPLTGHASGYCWWVQLFSCWISLPQVMVVGESIFTVIPGW